MKIKAIASALPDWIVDNDTISAWSGLQRNMLEDKIGVRERRFLRHNETATDLSVKAAERLLAEHDDLNFQSVGLLIVVTQNPDYKLPHMSALLQQRLGLSVTTACFDISLGCSGYVYALSVAKGFMLAEGIEEALIVTCDPYSKIMERNSRDVVGLFGDAASVTWLRSDGSGDIGRGDFGTDGAGAQSLIVESGGSANPHAHIDGTESLAGTPSKHSLQMNGRSIFNFMMTRVPATLEACLARNKLTSSDVDLFVFHQASRFLLETLRDKLGLDPAKVPLLMAETGNTVSSSIPLVLENLSKQGRCANNTVLVSGFGVGLSWASNIITFGGEK